MVGVEIMVRTSDIQHTGGGEVREHVDTDKSIGDRGLPWWHSG